MADDVKVYGKGRYKVYIKSSEDMSEIPDNFIGMTVTSPPYFDMRGEIEYDSYDVYLNTMTSILKENLRVTKESRYALWNCSDYMTKDGTKYPVPADLVKCAQKAGWKYVDDIIWVKPLGVGSNMSGSGNRAGNFIKYGLPLYYRPNNRYEHILVFQKGDSVHPDEEKKPEYKIDYKPLKTYMGDMWEFNPQCRNGFNKHKIHPAAFPHTLPNLCIQLYSLPGDTILEPFTGAGTTIIEALKLGRSAVGYEINEKYLHLIQSKLGIKDGNLLSYTA